MKRRANEAMSPGIAKRRPWVRTINCLDVTLYELAGRLAL